MNHPHSAVARNVCYHSVAALAFIAWHALTTLDDEVDYIWTMRNTNPYKWAYFFFRYVVILAHITHNSFIERLADGSNPPILCIFWQVYVLVLSQSLETLIELILASRIFALYNRSKRVAFLLLILVLTEIAWTTRSSLYHSVLIFIDHCLLLCLTWFKYIFALRAGWGRTPLVSLVVRDGSTVYATIIFVLTSVVLTCGLKNERGVAVFFWATSMTSVAGCHTILSMERFARRYFPRRPPQTLFTTEYSLGMLEFGRTLGSHQHESNIALPPTLRLHENVS